MNNPLQIADESHERYIIAHSRMMSIDLFTPSSRRYEIKDELDAAIAALARADVAARLFIAEEKRDKKIDGNAEAKRDRAEEMDSRRDFEDESGERG